MIVQSSAGEEIVVDYDPQPKQVLLHRSPANDILFGGAAGPGKSRALRMEGLIWCLRVPQLQVYLFRRTYPELEENHIINSLREFPQQAGSYNDQKKRWQFHNGSILYFRHCHHEKNVFAYQGAEIHLLLIDETTTFTQFIIDYLYGRVRCPLDIPDKYRHKIPGAINASNPGNVGHEYVKQRWVKYAKAYELRRAPLDKDNPEAPPFVRQYIPGLLEDNPHLMRTDPGYVTRLNALPEPYRTAYKTGNWDIFMGQVFLFSERHHVIKPCPIPEGAPLYMTFDWGFGKPYSVGFWFVDSDNRLYRFSEIYGQMRGAEVDTGVRQTDEVIADKIIERETELGLRDADGRLKRGIAIERLCDPTCFNKKPDYKGGGQGPSTAEVFAAKGLDMTPGDASRLLKIRQFHERLRIKVDPDGHERMPMMVVFDTCVDFIRTIPLLQADPNRPEDVDTKLEDHCYDEAALVCMARPISLDPRQVAEDIRIEAERQRRLDLDESSQAAWSEVDAIRAKLDQVAGLLEEDWEKI